MKATDRHKWLLEYIKTNGPTDILNRKFIEDYVKATGTKFKPTYWGADKSPILGRDLAKMAKDKTLERYRCGLSGGIWQPGFPKWVWSYLVPSLTR